MLDVKTSGAGKYVDGYSQWVGTNWVLDTFGLTSGSQAYKSRFHRINIYLLKSSEISSTKLPVPGRISHHCKDSHYLYIIYYHHHVSCPACDDWHAVRPPFLGIRIYRECSTLHLVPKSFWKRSVFGHVFPLNSSIVRLFFSDTPKCSQMFLLTSWNLWVKHSPFHVREEKQTSRKPWRYLKMPLWMTSKQPSNAKLCWFIQTKEVARTPNCLADGSVQLDPWEIDWEIFWPDILGEKINKAVEPIGSLPLGVPSLPDSCRSKVAWEVSSPCLAACYVFLGLLLNGVLRCT